MVIRIEAGKRFLDVADEAWLVINWCDPWSDLAAGFRHIPAQLAKKANSIVPLSFDSAQSGGFLIGDFAKKIDQGIFHRCRDFLGYAGGSSLIISILI